METEIIVGTNEEFILGFFIFPNKDGTFTLQSSFTNHSHIGRIKKLAHSGRYLASGSTDECIRLYDLETRKEVGCLSNHQGSVTCIEFHKAGFLFSGSEDGKISIFKRESWELVGELKGHKGGIVDLAIHPSGKLALSISKNKQMIIWDLQKGKKAFVHVLQSRCDLIKWSEDGSRYLIVSSNLLNIYDTNTGFVIKSYDFKNGIYCVCYLTDNLIAVGGECRDIAILDATSMEEVVRWEAHEQRTKALVKMDIEDSCCKFISGSSDGYIKIWRFNLQLIKSENAVKLIGEVNSKCRIICMTFTSEGDQMACKEKQAARKQHIRERAKRKYEERLRKRLKENDGTRALKGKEKQKLRSNSKTKSSTSTPLEKRDVTCKEDPIPNLSVQKELKDSTSLSGKNLKFKTGKKINKKRKINETNSSKKQKLLPQEGVDAEANNAEVLLSRDKSSSGPVIKKLKKKTRIGAQKLNATAKSRKTLKGKNSKGKS